MINAFYTAKSGVKNSQYYLDAVANNIANVNTQSFKAQNISFTDLLYSDFYNKEGVTLQNGNGSRIVISRDMGQGAAQRSDDKSDFMIDGRGFFAMMDSRGEITYTRSGSFSVHEFEGVNYLVSHCGDYVLDENLDRIELDTQSPVLFMSPGEAAGATDEEKENAVCVGLFYFSDSEKLIATGDGKYELPINTTMTTQVDMESKIVPGMNEASNVNLASEMAKLITAQRGFQINTRMIQTADEMEQNANNLSN